jgi:anti-sigma regulatory factor (Ser/Thr protein kinase)
MPDSTFSLRLRFRAEKRDLLRVRASVGALLRAAGVGFSEEDVAEILLGLHECLTNVARHSHQRDRGDSGAPIVGLHVALRRGRFVARVSERGRPYAPPGIAAPDQPREHGNGLFLLGSTMDRVRHLRRGRRNVVVLERAPRRATVPVKSEAERSR